MHRDKLIRLTTAVALGSIVLTIYWVFVFTTITVFELKVLKENLTETFYLSIVGIFAVLGGALIVNVILNLSKIAEALGDRRAGEPRPRKPMSPLFVLAVALSFPLLFSLLFLGDRATAAKKRAYLIESAEHVVTHNRGDVDHFTAYRFDRAHIEASAVRLRRLAREDENFPSVSIIQRDQIAGKNVFLHFDSYENWDDDKSDAVDKSDYIYPCSKDERRYLTEVFEGGRDEPSFSANDGNYELYYPAEGAGGRVVLYFTKYSRYGKMGS